MIKPHCEHFKPDPVAYWLCAWWDFEFEQSDPDQREWFCSRPEWEERFCETDGQRNIWEDGLSGPVGINAARLMGIELPPMEPERTLVENVAKLDTETED